MDIERIIAGIILFAIIWYFYDKGNDNHDDDDDNNPWNTMDDIEPYEKRMY